MPHDERDAVALIRAAEAMLSHALRGVHRASLIEALGLLAAAEEATPRGALLHSQLDTVRKWLAVLAEGEHARFGGSDRVRDHVALQFRLAQAAARDYLRATDRPD